MNLLKTNKNWVIALFLVGAIFFFIGKNSNPAKIEVAESAKIEAVSDVKAAEKSSAMVLAKKTTKSKTKANGSKEELTVEEFLSMNNETKNIEAHSVLKSEAVKNTTTINSLLFGRLGVIAPIQKDGLPSSKFLADAHALATISYGAHEAVLHSDLKASTWAGYAWGFGF